MSRAQLDFNDEDLGTPAPPAIPVEKIVEASRKAGFHETPRAAKAAAEPAPPSQPPRRTRMKTGRVHQFATRLRRETIDGFYAYADAHRITIAETLERAQKALSDTETDSC